MAFYEEEDLLNPEEQQNQGFQIGGQAGSLSAGAPSGSVSGIGGGKTPDNPGNFVGIKQYLDANKPQANKFGEQVGQNISGAIDTASQNVSGLQGQFEQEANKGLIKGFDTAQNEAGAITNKAASGMLGALPAQEEKTRFGEIANAQYTGPKNIQSAENVFNPVYQSVQEAQKLADLSKSEEGSQELAKTVANKESPYTKGANRLDSYLLNTQENKQRLENARQNAASLAPALDTAVQGSNQFAQGLQTKTDELRNNVRNLFANTAMGKRASVQEQLAQKQKEVEQKNSLRDQYYQLLSDSSDGGNLSLTPQQMDQLGLSENQNLYGALYKNPSAYLPESQSFDANSAIAKEDQARLAALSELAGTYGGDFTNPYTQPNLAGSANYDLTPFSGDKLKNEISKLQKSYEKEYTSGKGVASNFPTGGGSDYDIMKGAVQAFNGLPDIQSATPKELEELFLPRLDRFVAIGSPQAVRLKSQIESSIANWKNSKHVNDKVTKKV